MGFFDLNIPYLESSPTDKSGLRAVRMKLVVKAMEMGYTGIAYNRTMKGVMSDRDCCSIPFLSLSSLLKLAPSLSSSVQLHRDLLGVSRTSPFRQYTRLTVCVDNLAQGQALNSGNPVLKTYDLVAVRPLNQTAFEQACERMEVDIIAIDFSEKLPFRLKLPMVKAAIGRGVYFEITYSSLIADVQTRRQMISNVKFLMDWTRGKNIIISSCAPSVNELRGPNDVSNLMSLFGLPMERAKAAISKNCRTLVANALRKKNFYKEAIRVEVMPPGQQLDSKKTGSADWLKWDPISSGEGDLLLDDLVKGFSASDKSSKTVKAIDFNTVLNSMPSQGFQVKDLISGNRAVSQLAKGCKSLFSGFDTLEVSVATEGVSEQANQHNYHSELVHTSVYEAPSGHQTTESSPNLSSMDCLKVISDTKETATQQASTEEELKTLNESDEHIDSVETEMHDVESQKHVFSCESNDALRTENMEAELGCAKVSSDTKETKTESSAEEPKTRNEVHSVATEMHDIELQKHVFSWESNVVLPAESEVLCTSGMEIESDATKIEISTQSQENSGFVCLNEETKSSANQDVLDAEMDHVETERGEKSGIVCLNEEFKSSTNYDLLDVEMGHVEVEIDEKCKAHASLHENISEIERLQGPADDADIIANEDRGPHAESFDGIKGTDDFQLANHKVVEEVEIEEQRLGDHDTEVKCLAPVQSRSGNSRAKQRIPRGSVMFPFKRLMNPVSVPFKRKPQKSKSRNKRV